MRALVWKLSVTMPIWAPVKLMAGWPSALDGHGHEGDGDLLAGGQEHVHLAGRRLLADLAGQRDQLVGGVAAGADDDDDLVAGLLGPEARRAAAMIRSAVATLLPPNFCTTRGTARISYSCRSLFALCNWPVRFCFAARRRKDDSGVRTTLQRPIDIPFDAGVGALAWGVSAVPIERLTRTGLVLRHAHRCRCAV